MLEYGYEQQQERIDGALVEEILGDSVNKQLLALAEPHYLASGGGRVSAFANPVAGSEQHAAHEPGLTHAPLTGYQPFAQHARCANDVRGTAPGKRPGSLDAALKALSESLD